MEELDKDSAMPNSFCLLCLTNVEDGPVSSPTKKIRNSKNNTNKSRNIKIGTLLELIRPFWPHPILNKYEEHETCSLCANCSLATREAEEIRDQISKLETRLREKVDTIKFTLLVFTDKKESGEYQDEFDRILAIRRGLIDKTQPRHKGVNEKVKVEQVKEDFEDNFIYNDDNNDPPFSPTGDDFYTHDKDSDSDSDYCIQPDSLSPKGWSPKKIKSPANSPSKNQNNTDTESTPFESPVKQETTTCRRSTRSTKPRKFDSLEKFFDDDKELAKTTPTKKRKLSKPAKRYVPKRKKRNTPTDWKCPICESYFPSEEDLNTHQARLKRPCPLCSSTFCSNNELQDHIKESHTTTRAYRCPHCVKKTSFKQQNTLDQHMYMKHETGEKTHTCPQCDKKFSLEYNLQRHVNLHKVEKTRSFVCDVCDSRYSSREVLEKHGKTHEKLRCSLCDFETFRQIYLTKHIRIHTGETPFKCPHCEESFIDDYYRKMHIFRVHETTPENQCHICAKTYFSVGQLNAHLKKHEEKTQGKKVPVLCSTCGKEFKTVLKMKTHRVLMHGDEPCICDECGGSYMTLKALSVHKRNKHSNTVKTANVFKCDLCEATFRTKASITYHIKTHTGEVERYNCPNCGYSYQSKSHLQGHMIRIHNVVYEEETRHKCDPCGKGFPTKGLLDWHIRQLHTGDGPKYTCTHCEAMYADHTMLTWHIRKHHGLMVGGERKHSKHWKVKPKQKKGTQVGLSSSTGESTRGQPKVNNLVESVIVDDAVVWGMDRDFFG